VAWHEAYDVPASWLSARLTLVQQHLAAALDRAPPGPIRPVSLCAGQGRDVIETLPGHPRGGDVTAVLAETEPANVTRAREAASAGWGWLPLVRRKVTPRARNSRISLLVWSPPAV